MRLRTKTSLVLVTIVAVLLGLAAALSLKMLQESLRGATSSGLVSLAQNTARWLASYRDGGLQVALAMASELPLEALVRRDRAVIESYLESMTRLHPNFDNGVFLLDADGNLWADYPRHPDLHGMSFAQRDYFQRTIKAGQGVVGSPYLSERSGEPVLTFTALVRDGVGRVQGLLGCSARLLSPNAPGGGREQTIGTSGYVYVYDRTLLMIMHPSSERILQRDVLPGTNSLFDRAIDGFEGVGETVNSRGIPMMVALQQVPGSDWIVAAQLPLAEAFASLEEARYRLMLNVVVGALAALLLGLVAVRRLTAPLFRLQQMALHLSVRFSGASLQPLKDNGAHLREWENFRGDDEVMDLHQALRKFSDDLALSLGTLRDVVKSWEDTFDAVPDMIFILDRDHRIVRCNRAVSQLLNRPSQEFSGQSCHRLIQDSHLPAELGPGWETLVSGVTSHREIEIRSLNRVLDISTIPLVDDNGRPVGSVHVARDITERKLAEEALRESEQRYHTLFDAALDPILLTDEQGRVTDCNPAAASFFQTPVEALIGTPLLGGAEANNNMEMLSLASAEQELLRLVRSGVPQRFEWTFYPLQNPQILAEVSLSPIVIGGQAGMLALIRDISKQKEVQRLINQERDRLNAVLDGSPMATAMISPHREVLLWNHAAEALTLYSRDQVLGRPLDLSPILENSSDPVLADLLLDLTEAEILKEHGRRGIRKFDLHPEAIEAKGNIVVGDRVKRLHVIACKVRDPEGRMLGVLQCAQDITREEQLQKQLLQAQKMESIGTLAGGMAHEFNNILAAIQGYTQLGIRECYGQEPLTAYLKVVETSCQRAAKLVRNMLTFAHADEGGKIPVKVNRLLAGIQQLLRQTLPPDVVLELDFEPGLPFILADPNQVEQVVVNLAVNANDAMPKGGVITLRSRLHSSPPLCLASADPARQGPYVEIGVIDVGEGIPGEIRERIFDPFFSTKPPGKGTGLGLSIVYSIMENHHGCVLVESASGQGTHFRLYFPGIQEVLSAAPASHPPQCLMPGRGEAVLVVDDEDRLREMLVEVLEANGYSVGLASNGREALDLYRQALATQAPFGLVLLDLAMPVMSGQECIKELLVLDPKVKILVMSGLLEAVEKDQDLQRVRGFLHKPFLLTTLLQDVRRVLENEIKAG